MQQRFFTPCAGIIPLIYVAIGVKVGSELAGVIDDLVKETA